jgi:hypothetical protein
VRRLRAESRSHLFRDPFCPKCRAYEGAFAGVYKVNESLDVGFSYYPLLFSTFTDGERYSKLRVRYSHYMVELSAFGKSALDIKYVMGTADKFGDHDRTVSSYIGLTWIGNREERKGVGGGAVENGIQYVQLSTGYLF